MTLIERLEKETGALRARDVARLFQVTHQHIYKMAAAGAMPSFRVAGAIRFDPHELANWLRRAQPACYGPAQPSELRRSA
jgi:predicted DNA-binding transcriptional regulator AlpA